MSLSTIQRGIDEGLVLHVPFTEGSGAKVFDRSPEANHGDVTVGGGGLGAFWTNTKDGLPLGTFDGLATRVDFTIPTVGKTLAIWIYIENITRSDIFLAHKVGDYRQVLSQKGNRFGGTIYDGADDWVSGSISSVIGWHHVAMTSDGIDAATVDVLIDGIRTLDTTDVQTMSSTVGTTVGNDTNGTDPFLGKGYDARIYDRILADQEIRYLASMRRRR